MKLTNKQQAFVREYQLDCNATQAAIRAGYSALTAQEQGSRLLSNVMVQQALASSIAVKMERNDITLDWVLARLMEGVERAMQSVPVLDKAGNAIGMYTFNAAAANRGLELLGKHLGMFSERRKFDGDVVVRVEREYDYSQLTDEELEQLHNIAIKATPVEE